MFLGQIYNILYTIILTIKVMAIGVAGKIGEFLNNVLMLIELPFIRLGKDLLVFTPFINKLAKIISESVGDFITGIGVIFNFFLAGIERYSKIFCLNSVIVFSYKCIQSVKQVNL